MSIFGVSVSVNPCCITASSCPAWVLWSSKVENVYGFRGDFRAALNNILLSNSIHKINVNNFYSLLGLMTDKCEGKVTIFEGKSITGKKRS